jgi:N-acetylglucosaminyldiphosphoundecaprenol N-acetyl-beta-D-mannosaminyltransferase
LKSLPITAASVSLFGVPVHVVTMSSALDIVDQAITSHQRLQIGVVNAAKLVNMNRDPALRQDVLSSNLILADGIAVVWASRLLGRPLPERVTGIDLMMGMLERGNTRRYSIYCLGASEDVSAAVAQRIESEYPGVRLVGRQHGYFKEVEEEAVAKSIADARPDILLVAMTSPKKEKFMAKWIDQTEVPVFHGVGGSFDVFSGKVRRAPPSWQRLGLEWFYRLKQEPSRLWRRYLVTNSLFCGMVMKEWWRGIGKNHE